MELVVSFVSSDLACVPNYRDLRYLSSRPTIDLVLDVSGP